MPLYKKIHFEDGMILTLWKIEETESQLLDLLNIESVENKRELECIKAPRSRLRWLASRLALRSLFDSKTAIDIEKDIHGKPFFKILNGHLSLSHSGEFASCLYHPEKSVGLDIELIRPKIFDISTKFMKAAELNVIPKANTMESLLVCWCAKEAIYKWQGRKGLSMKEGITIHPFVYEEKGMLMAELVNAQGKQVLKVHYERIENYMLAYVCND